MNGGKKIKGIYAITPDQINSELLLKQVKACCEGGVNVLQYRSKTLSWKKRFEQAKEIKQITDDYKIPLIINDDIEDLSVRNNSQMETVFDRSINTTSSVSRTPDSDLTLSSTIKARFQLHIPEDLPPSLTHNRTPSVIYTLELDLASSSYRYQIPITLNSRGCIPHPMTDIEVKSELTSNETNSSSEKMDIP